MAIAKIIPFINRKQKVYADLALNSVKKIAVDDNVLIFHVDDRPMDPRKATGSLQVWDGSDKTYSLENIDLFHDGEEVRGKVGFGSEFVVGQELHLIYNFSFLKRTGFRSRRCMIIEATS